MAYTLSGVSSDFGRTKTLNLSCLAANHPAQLPWWTVWEDNMCHGVKQKAFYNLPEGQAALLQKFNAGQAKRLRHCDIKQQPSLLQWRQSQGHW